MTTDAETIDLRPKEVNLLLYQGDTTVFTVTFPVSVSMTGSTGKMRIQRLDGSTALTLTTGGGIVLSGQVFTTTITKTQAAALPTDVVMPYDWQWTDASNNERTVVQGTVRVQAQKTTS